MDRAAKGPFIFFRCIEGAQQKGQKSHVMTQRHPPRMTGLFAQYPTQEAISKSSIMVYFDSDKNDVINQMWINVRCFNLYDVPVWAWAIAAAVAAVLIYLFVRMKQRQKMYE